MNRRHFLGATAISGLTARAWAQDINPPVPEKLPPILPIRAQPDRIFRTTVCLRPFRAAGPRLDTERLGDKLILHNYGHGGSGWSLSWGSASLIVEKALAANTREVAVVGCGALGLTSAILLQQAGLKVTIYAKERPPDVRSSNATGSWTPDSRIALTTDAAPGFPALWEKMARRSFRIYQSYLGAPGNPIEWTDRYSLSDRSPTDPEPSREQPDALSFAKYQDRIEDVTPRSHDLPPGSHPFPTRYARRNSGLMFNVAGYSRQLIHDFLTEGGTIERHEFHSPADLKLLSQRVIVNATGYGARALWKDESIVPVRGQIAWLIPQPEVNYGFMYKGIYVLSRRDGIVVQAIGNGEMDGYNDSNEQPDRKEAEAAVQLVADLYQKMKF